MKTKADLINDATLVADLINDATLVADRLRHAPGLSAAIIIGLYCQAPARVQASFGYDVAELFKLAGWLE